VGGAIGSVKGAVAGAKDAFAQGKEQGFDSSRANQAGAAVGATGEANPYAKQSAQADNAQQPAAAAGGTASAPTQASGTQTTQSTGSTRGGPVGKTAPGPDTSTEPEQSTVGDAARAVGNKVAGGINAATDAIKAGQGMGTSMQSLAQISEPNKGAVKIKDAQGQEHAYKKVGQQWFDSENKPVNAAQAAMLDKQAEQQAAMGKDKAALAGPQGEIPGAKPPAATTQEPMKLGGKTLDPKDPASAKIIAQVQKQQGAAAPGTPDPRDLNKDGTVDATEKSIARNKAKTGGQAAPVAQGTATQGADATARGDVNKGFGFNSQTGKPYASAEDAKAGEAENEKNSVPTPQQVQNRADAKAANPFGFNDQTGEPFKSQAEADAFNTRRQKQSAAAATAQDQMAANPAPAQQPAAVWKNNRAPEGTPASTSPQAAAATAQQPADKQPNDVMARMAKQLAPADKPAAPNFSQQGYASVKTNAPTGIPQVGGPQPTAGAKAVPAQQPAAAPAAAPAPTASAQADAGKPGFLQSKIKGSQVPAKQPEMAGTDFSAMLARKAKIRL
jgi:hypothetical protein